MTLKANLRMILNSALNVLNSISFEALVTLQQNFPFEILLAVHSFYGLFFFLVLHMLDQQSTTEI